MQSERDPGELSQPSYVWGHNQKTAVYEQAVDPDQPLCLPEP